MLTEIFIFILVMDRLEIINSPVLVFLKYLSVWYMEMKEGPVYEDICQLKKIVFQIS